jgi:ABC-type multidrug transport system fused ATPase/permease subunit
MQKYFSHLKTLWQIFKPFRKYFYIQLGIVFISQVFSITISLLNSHLINALVAKNINTTLLILFVWGIVVILLNIITYAQNWVRERKLDQSVAQYLQEYSLKKILSLTVEQHIESHSAIKQQIISRGETAAENILGSFFTNIVPTILYTLVALATLAYYSVLLAITSIIIIIVLFAWSINFRKFHNPYVRKNRDNWTLNNKIRTEAFTHLVLAKLFGREDFFVEKYIDRRAIIVKHHSVTRTLAIKHMFKLFTVRGFSELVTLSIAVYLFLHGSFQVGTLYLVFSVCSRIYNNIDSFSSSLRDMPIWFLEVEKYIEAITMKPSFKEHGITTVPLTTTITFSNVSFFYPLSQDSVLEDVSFSIEPSKTTAFVGASGSGKSTIVKLLLRAYTYNKGSITIGDTELKEIDTTYLRERVGYVEQHVDLLDETVRENIVFGVKDGMKKIKEEKLEEIAHLARIDQFYHRLGEKRFNTVVGERGIKLSGGERQRVGIARAIIKNPDILIFDEATSSLDTENEKYVMDAINDVSQGKTTIIIAHRLSTVRDADKIIVMDKGTVAGEGTHDELMATNPIYQNLVAHQLSD